MDVQEDNVTIDDNRFILSPLRPCDCGGTIIASQNNNQDQQCVGCGKHLLIDGCEPELESYLDRSQSLSTKQATIFDIRSCWCGGTVQVSPDGNRYQQCKDCGKWLLFDGREPTPVHEIILYSLRKCRCGGETEFSLTGSYQKCLTCHKVLIIDGEDCV